jgi:hypothetical protein
MLDPKSLVDPLMWLIRFVIPPVRIEIEYLHYDEVSNEPGDAIVILTPYPRCYVAEISFTNRANRTVYLREVRLQVAKTIFVESENTPNLRLEAHERKTMQIVFPLGSGEEPQAEAPFVLAVTPTVGRRSRATGNLPVCAADS